MYSARVTEENHLEIFLCAVPGMLYNTGYALVVTWRKMEAILSLFFNFFCSTLEKSLRQKIAESGFNGSNVRSQERQVTLYCTENSPNRVFISLYEKKVPK